jgi:hypothetical protein
MQPLTCHTDRMNTFHCNRQICTAYATVLVSSISKHSTQEVLVADWQSQSCGCRTMGSLTSLSIKYATESTAAGWMGSQSRSQMSLKLVFYRQGACSCGTGGVLRAASTLLIFAVFE